MKKKSKVNQFITICISYILITMPLHTLQAAQLEIDKTTKTRLDISRNGVPIVNIANPNAKGLSHNKFKNYNVNKKGLILNNSRTNVNTQLGGFISGNKNLNRNAKVILNEVTSSNLSNLNGYTEVAGVKADLIIANPNGININGAGFINTNRVTLSTSKPNIINGTPFFGDPRGDININGEGLNTKSQKSTYIYAAYLKLNAKIHAQNLNIKLGNSQSNKIKDNNKKRELLLDSTALGGMYANKISLVGTSKGLGVNLPPEVLASSGDIEISSDGKIILAKMTAKKEIKVHSNSDIILNDNVYANDIKFKTKQTLTNNALLLSNKLIEINAKKFNNKKELIAGVNFNNSLNNNGILKINTENLNNFGKLQSTNLMNITNKQNLINKNGKISSLGDLNINTKTANLTSSNIYANNNLNLTLDMLNNVASSVIQSRNNMQITTINNIINNSQLLANGSITLNTNADLINKNIISSRKDLTINALNLINKKTISGGKGVSKLNITKDILNSSKISSAQDLQVNANNIVNDGYFNSGKDLTITSTNLTNKKTLFSTNNMNLYTYNTLLNTQNANIFAFNDLTIAKNNDKQKSSKVINISSNIQSHKGNINIFTDQLVNKRSKDMNDDVFFIKRRVSDKIYFDEDLRGGKVVYGSKGLVRVKGTDSNDNFNAYVDRFGFRLKVDLAREPFSYHFATFGAILNEKIPYNNPNYKASSILAGKNLNLTANNVINEISNISSVNDINLNVSGSFINRTNKYSGDLTITLYNTGIDRRGDKRDKKHYGRLYRNGNPIMTSGDVWGDYSYGTYKVANNDPKFIFSSVSAGGNINGDVKYINNGNIKSKQVVNSAKTKKEKTSSIGTNINGNIKLPKDDYGLFVKAKNPDSKYLIETNPDFILEKNFISSDYFLDKIGFDEKITKKRLGDAFYENKLIRDSIFAQTGKRFLNKKYSTDHKQYQHLMDNALSAQKDLELIAGIALSIEQLNALDKDIVWMVEVEVAGEKVLVPQVYIANANSIKIEGSQIVAGKDLQLKVDKIVNSGTIEAGEKIAINSKSDITNYGGTIKADKDIKLLAKNDIKNISGNIKATNISLKATNIINKRYTKTLSDTNNHYKYNGTLVGAAGSITAKNTLEMDAKKDILFEGSNAKAKNLDLKAKTITLTTTKNSQSSKWGKNYSYQENKTITHKASNLNGANINLTSTDTTTIEGSNVNAKNNLNIKAKTIDILAAKNINNFNTKYGYKDEKTTHQASNLDGTNINLTSADTTTIAGSNVNAKNNLNIKAKTIDILAAKNIDNINTKYGYKNEKTTHQASNLNGANINLTSADTTTIAGSNVNAKNNLNIKAKTIDILAVKNSTNFDTGGGDNYTKERSTTHQASNLNGANINLTSADTTTIKGSNVNAKNHLNIKAKKIDILAVNDTYFKETKTTDKGFFSTKVTVNTKSTSTNIASNLNGASISLNTTEDDINIIGSNINATNSIEIDSASNVNIQAGYDGSYTQSVTTKSGFGVGGGIYGAQADTIGSLSKIAKNAKLNAANISIRSKYDTTIIGADLKAKDINLKAEDGNVIIANATNKYENWQESKKLGISLNLDFKKVLAFGNGALFGDGLSVAKAKYSKTSTKTKITKVQQSTIQTDNLNINANNILLQSAKIDAKKDVILEAKENVKIVEAKDTKKTVTDEESGEADIKIKVKNEYAETAKAVNEVNKARKTLKQTKQKYDEYKSYLVKQKKKFAQLKIDLKNGKKGVEQEDIDEFKEILEDLKDDNKFYQAAIAAAAVTLTSKTIAVATQGAKAATSGYAGFNASLQLDMKLQKKRSTSQSTTSVGSRITANKFIIKAGKTATIQGSNIDAQEGDIEARDIKILASKDDARSKSQTATIESSTSIDLTGPATTPSQGSSAIAKTSSIGVTDISTSLQQDTSKTTTYNNSKLNFRKLTLKSKKDTTINGANIYAKDKLALKVGGNLNIKSKQNKAKSTSQSASIGTAQGASAALSRQKSKTTVLTTLEGGKVDIDVGKDTTIIGAKVASIDENGNDNKKLTLKTKKLTTKNLSSTTYSRDISLGGSVSESPTVTANLNLGRSNSKTKILATIGNGKIVVADKKNSTNIEEINRDIKNDKVDIYDVKSDVTISAEVDTRVFSEDGRSDILNDIKTTKVGIVDVVKDIVTEESVGVTDIFDHQKRSVAMYNGMQEAVKNDTKLQDALSDPNLTKKQKEQLLRKLAVAVAKKLNIKLKKESITVVSSNTKTKKDEEIAGVHDKRNGNVVINDKNINNTGEAIGTSMHELSHIYDAQNGSNKNEDSKEEYAKVIGKKAINYADFAMYNYTNGKKLANSNSHLNLEPNLNPNGGILKKIVDSGKGEYWIVPAIKVVKGGIKGGIKLYKWIFKKDGGKKLVLNPKQVANIKRFKKKIPANSKSNVEIKKLPKNGIVMKATSPGKVPGSKAIYQKYIDANGNTIKMIKTTYDPKGRIVHVKNK